MCVDKSGVGFYLFVAKKEIIALVKNYDDEARVCFRLTSLVRTAKQARQLRQEVWALVVCHLLSVQSHLN